MKIFAAGIATETNTFCPLLTSVDDFQIHRGKASRRIESDAQMFDLPNVWGTEAQLRGDQFVFSLMAWAPPSGITVKSTYEALRDEILNDLRAALPVDVVLLMLHGAMIAQEYEDCEQDLIERVRQIVGPAVIIGVELDLHCHLTDSKLSAADVVLTYKEYPHVDVNDRARDLFRLSVAARLGQIKPTMALFDCQMIGQYPTSRQPLRGLVDAMSAAEKRPGVLSVSFGHGFQFADVPTVGAKVLVVTDNNESQAAQIAREFGYRLYAVRREIGVDAISLPMDMALTKALASQTRPIVVADQSDNPGAGAPSDATFALRWLLDHRAEDVAIAFFYDPEVVKAAKRAGVGAALPVRLGGKTGPASGTPVDLEVIVHGLRDNYVHLFPQESGEPARFFAGDVAALRCGTVDVIVSSNRCQCFAPSIFSDLDIDPSTKHLLIPKSTQHFFGAFAPIAAEVIYMSAPGAVVPDPRRIPYRRLDTSRLFPWNDDPIPGQTAD